MKIIVAGFMKTGTKSVHAALSELGYSVYDVAEHSYYHYNEWMKILTSSNGGTTDDFKRMYSDVDVAIDLPVFLFWEEIHKAFPDSKIILLTRDEDKFYKSFRKQADELDNNLLFRLIKSLSPLGRRLQTFYTHCLAVTFGIVRSTASNYDWLDNEMLIKRGFRHHQQYCLQNAPKDKLLVYQVTEGWEPLCKFLGKEVPDTPFPRENIAATILGKLMKTHPLLHQMKIEAACVISAVVGASACGLWAFFNSSYYTTVSEYFFSLLS